MTVFSLECGLLSCAARVRARPACASARHHTTPWLGAAACTGRCLSHAVAARCAQLKASCVQYIRGMFEIVKETEAWGQLDEALRGEVVEIRAPKDKRRWAPAEPE